MAKKWGLPPENPDIIPEKKPKKTGLAKVKSKIAETPVDDFADLIDKSRIAELEQEISKAETMKYKAEQERLKLKRAAGEVMEFDKGDLLFFGFIDKCSIEMLRVMDKLEPTIKNLSDEGDIKAIKILVNREFENILTDIQEEQSEIVKKWKKGLN